MNYFANAGQFLIEIIFGAAIGLLILRVLLQLVHANFHNPICQFLYRVTNPILIPLRRIIPAWRGLDVAGVLLAWLLTVLKLVIMFAMIGESLGLVGLALMAHRADPETDPPIAANAGRSRFLTDAGLARHHAGAHADRAAPARYWNAHRQRRLT